MSVALSNKKNTDREKEATGRGKAQEPLRQLGFADYKESLSWLWPAVVEPEVEVSQAFKESLGKPLHTGLNISPLWLSFRVVCFRHYVVGWPNPLK